MAKDYSLVNNFRRAHSFTDRNEITGALPGYFIAEYPKLTKILEKYYQFEDSDQSPARLVYDVLTSRDITANDETLLSFIEDELLLGQSYFEGFQNKRAAAKYSSNLYRSKGTLYSLQQFFRTFYGIAPEIRYTKEDRFMIGQSDSKIGPESLKYITDNKLYQAFAILIKAELPVDTWREAYKLFVHPAGMYFGAEVTIETTNVQMLRDSGMPDFERITTIPVVQGEATMAFGHMVTDLTGEVDSDGPGTYGKLRIDLPGSVEEIQNISIDEINQNYRSISELIGTSSPTFDGDSSTNVADMSQDRAVFDTMDEVKYTYYDSDSA